VLGTLILAASLQAAPHSTDGARIDRILAQALDPAASTRALGAELAAEGPASIPELYARLLDGRTGAGEPFSTAQRETLLEGIAHSGRGAVRAFLEPRVQETVSTDERAAIVELCGRIGTGADVELVMLAAAPNPRAPIDGRVRQALAAAMSGILGRDERAVGAFGWWIRRSSTEIAATIVVGAAEHPTEALVTVLTGCLGLDRGLDPVLLSAIGRVGDALDEPVSEEVAREIEAYLELDEPALVREAALALGRLEDFDAAAELIPLLEHGERGVREAASWALGRLSGMNFRCDVARWSSWLRAEELWFEEEIAGLASRLEEGESPAVLRALGEVSVHRFQRHRLAQEVGVALENEDPLVRRIACVCLARLGSPAARVGLVRALDDPDASVAAAAHAALGAIESGARVAGPAGLSSS
jgi:hypothetical protein